MLAFIRGQRGVRHIPLLPLEGPNRETPVGESCRALAQREGRAEAASPMK